MRVAWVALVAGCGFQTPGVTDAVTPDAAPGADIDASVGPVFDPASCPTAYNLLLSDQTRYRLIIEGRPAWTHSDDCDDDLVGATHLVVLETMLELQNVGLFVDTTTALPGNGVWIGGVQKRTATRPQDEWLGLDDMPLINGWAVNEPNDDTREDQGEQFVKIERARHYFVDIEGTENNSAICECDGKPVAPAARAALAANRIPPLPP